MLLRPDTFGPCVGETRVRVELFDLMMTERTKADYPLAPRERGVDVIVGAILTGLATVLANAGVDISDVLGIGVGVPGIVEHGPEVLVHGQTFDWDSIPLERLLRSGTGLPLPGDDQESALAALINSYATSPAAAEVLDDTALYLGVGIANLINLFNPERIIVGGWAGLLLGDQMLPAIRAAARQHSLRHPFDETFVELGRLGPDAVALGAATLPVERFLNSRTEPASKAS